jgi:hypothetical protein
MYIFKPIIELVCQILGSGISPISSISLHSAFSKLKIKMEEKNKVQFEPPNKIKELSSKFSMVCPALKF